MSHGSLLHNSSFLHQFHPPINLSMLLPQRPCIYSGKITSSQSSRDYQGRYGFCRVQFRVLHRHTIHSCPKFSDGTETKICDGESNTFLHVQTLRNFPMEELFGKSVIVRFDASLLLQKAVDLQSVNRALRTIQYIYNAGAKVLITSNWGVSDGTMLLSTQCVADYLSSVLQLKVVPATGISGYTESKFGELEKADVLLLDNLSQFREEAANCTKFSKKLSLGVDIFVNDAFSQSHKMLASTVAVARSCYASVAGFRFEAELSQLMEVTKTARQPYISIIGGGRLTEKAAALRYLASKCDGLVFVGTLAFQIMHALGMPVSLSFVEHGAIRDALEIIQLAKNRNIPILYPKDFWCMNDSLPKLLDIFPSDGIISGWTPVNLGPSSWSEIFSLLSKSKKILWIGPVEFGSSRQETHGSSQLAVMLEKISGNNCDVIIVGNAACKAVMATASSLSAYNIVESASVIWEFLSGRTLPGVAALDRAYPIELDWNAIFADSTQPLIVDIGSGNGLFLLRMAKRWRTSNFLGLEINKKLVRRCLECVSQSGLRNGYFICTNATSTFHSIISSYPGELALVSIQVFLQSDIEAVAIRMKDQFTMYGKGRLTVANEGDDLDQGGWLKENPFGIRSDWEQHVIDRGGPMYRLMLSKVDTDKNNKS
ncbi:phosphoglycerate kinase, cytosolic-like isoform X2 [Tasmannia lanceolata]|uniref:phosphoglycerate kinase, cytosolic-like isoform X2 n=1 Tax=Tasmannia lanceolata TaxID=3420 RepID=UPI0040645CAD